MTQIETFNIVLTDAGCSGVPTAIRLRRLLKPDPFRSTIADIHHEIANGSAEWVRRAAASLKPKRKRKRSRPSDIAIIGMAGRFPGAGGVEHWPFPERPRTGRSLRPRGRHD